MFTDYSIPQASQMVLQSLVILFWKEKVCCKELKNSLISYLSRWIRLFVTTQRPGQKSDGEDNTLISALTTSSKASPSLQDVVVELIHNPGQASTWIETSRSRAVACGQSWKSRQSSNSSHSPPLSLLPASLLLLPASPQIMWGLSWGLCRLQQQSSQRRPHFQT